MRAPRPGPRSRLLVLVVLLLLAALLVARGRAPGAPSGLDGHAAGPAEALAGATTAFRFVDLAPSLGLARSRWSALMRHAKIIGTVGGGVAWGDYDGDGWPDLYLTQGVSRPGAPGHASNCGRLLRNEQGRGLRDVTAASGIAACGWGMGALFEDLDGDGHLDLFLTFLGQSQLWWNQGDGTFREGGAAAGVASSGWHAGAAALDADGSGRLSLFVTRYLDTSAEAERRRAAFDLPPIDDYTPRSDLLFLNLGARRFAAAPPEAIAAPAGRGLSVIAADFDLDGRADLYVANDRNRNTLLRGLGGGRFEDVTDLAGVGLGEAGQPEAGMGVTAADLSGDGRLDLLVTNYAGEPATLYRNLGDLVFQDESRSRGVAASSTEWLGWATELLDLDNDGELDLYLAHGHLVPAWVPRLARLLRRERAETLRPTFQGPFRQPLVLLRGSGGRLQPVPAPTSRPGVWRGGGAADFDGDGRLDLFIYSSDRRTRSLLLANRTDGGHWLRVSLRGPGAPPPAAGARLSWSATGGVPAVGRRARHAQVTSGGSYLSGSALPLHFGLGGAGRADLELRRTGQPELRLVGLPADRVLVF